VALISPQVIRKNLFDGVLDPSVSGYLVPQRAIMMFDTSCPTGWSRFANMDNTFPMGGSTYGATGGAANHSHTLIEGTPEGAGGANTVGVGNPGGSMGSFSGGSSSIVYPTKDTTTSASNLPPYLTIVFCQKN